MTYDLNDFASWPFLDGAQEIVLRVSRYEDGDPAKGIGAYQCIIDPRDKAVPRSVGVRANPVAALTAALEDFQKNLARAGTNPGAETLTPRKPSAEEMLE